jgi:hypothetical protein
MFNTLHESCRINECEISTKPSQASRIEKLPQPYTSKLQQQTTIIANLQKRKGMKTLTTQIHHRKPTTPFELSSSAETLTHHNTQDLENPTLCKLKTSRKTPPQAMTRTILMAKYEILSSSKSCEHEML